MGETSSEFIGGKLCLDFSNAITKLFKKSYKSDRDRYEALLDWCREADCLPDQEIETLRKRARRHPREVASALRRAKRLAWALRRAFTAAACCELPSAKDLAALNAEISKSLSMARLVPTGEGITWGWAADAERLDRVLWPIARSGATLLASEGLDRVRVCADDSCQWLFLDLSKNQRRRWCDMKVCGNRAKVRKFRSRSHQHTGSG